MTKKNKILAGVLAGVLALGVAGTALVCCEPNKDKKPTESGSSQQTESSANQVTGDFGDILDEEVNVMPARMTFRQARAISGSSEYSSVTVQATVKPDNATNKNVAWSVAFVNPTSKWATGKSVTDYVTVKPQAEVSNIATVECLKPFGEQIRITVTSESNPEAKAETTVDFAKHILKVPFDVQCFEENYSVMDKDFAMDALYLNVGLSWDLWIDEPACVYTDYTVDDDFDTVLEITCNEDVLAQFNADTGFFVEPATLERDETEGAIYGSLMSTLDGVNWNVLEYSNKLNNWFKENTDKAMFTLRYKAVGQYSTYEAEIPIFVNVDELSVIVTEIKLNQSTILF